jgi:hypothetical protein
MFLFSVDLCECYRFVFHFVLLINSVYHGIKIMMQTYFPHLIIDQSTPNKKIQIQLLKAFI